MGAGMEETYQITSAVRHLPFGKQVAVITDARFSGVSTGACIGHVSPEALAGGPIGKLRDGDLVEIVINQRTQEGSIDFIGDESSRLSREKAAHARGRAPRPDLAADEKLPMTPDLGSAAGRQRRNVGRCCVRCRFYSARSCGWQAGTPEWIMTSEVFGYLRDDTPIILFTLTINPGRKSAS
jgi:hypothetical protein